MKALEQYGPLAARVLLATIFLVSGFGKLADPGASAGYIASHGLPLATLLAVGAGLLEVAGGALVLLGFRARWGALALAAFLIPTTFIFHNPVGLEGMEAQMQLIHAMKNLAIIGGLVSIAAFGSGAFSLDTSRARRAVPQPA